MKRKALLSAIIASTLSAGASAATFTKLENGLNLNDQETSLINRVMSMNTNENIADTLYSIEFNDIDGKIAAARLAVSRHDREGYRNAELILSQVQQQNGHQYSNEINEILLELSGAPELMLMSFEINSLLNTLGNIHASTVDYHLIQAATNTLTRLRDLTQYSRDDGYPAPAPGIQELTRLADALLIKISMMDTFAFDPDSRIEFYQALPSFIEAYSKAPANLNSNFRLLHFLNMFDWQEVSGFAKNHGSMSIADAVFNGLILEKKVNQHAPTPYYTPFYAPSQAHADISEFLIGLPQGSPASNYFGSYFMDEGREYRVEQLLNQQIALYASNSIMPYQEPLRVLDSIFTNVVGGDDRYTGILLKSMLAASEGVKASYNHLDDPAKLLELKRFYEMRLSNLAQFASDPMLKDEINYVFEQMLNNPSTLLILPNSFIQALNPEDISKEIASFISNPPTLGTLSYSSFKQGLNRIFRFTYFAPEDLIAILTSATEGELNDMKRATIEEVIAAPGFDPMQLQDRVNTLVQDGQYEAIDLLLENNYVPIRINVDADRFGSGKADRVAYLYADGNIARRLKSSNHYWTVSFPMLENQWGLFNVSVEGLMRFSHCTDVMYSIDEDGSGPSQPITLPQSHAMNSGQGNLDLPLGQYNLNGSSTLTISSENCGTKQAWIDNVILEKL